MTPPGPVTFEEARKVVEMFMWTDNPIPRLLAFLAQCEAERKEARELVQDTLDAVMFGDIPTDERLRAFLERTAK